jgi:hypothetical protein
MTDDELLGDLWRADERFLSIVLMIERGLQEVGLDVTRDQVATALCRELAAWQLEVGTRPAVREQIVAEVDVAFPGDLPEGEVEKFVEDRLFEMARKTIDVRDIVNATVLALLGLHGVDLIGEMLAGDDG